MSLEQLLGRASLLLDARQHKAAAALIDVALGMVPDSAAALALRARCLLQPATRSRPSMRPAKRRADPTASWCATSWQRASRRPASTGCGGSGSRSAGGTSAGRGPCCAGSPPCSIEDRLFVLVCAYTATQPPLSPEDREEVLSWLLREELDAAADALERNDHKRARAAAERADAIDARSMHAALLGAQAIYQGVMSDPTASGIALRPVLADLRRARELLQRLDESEDFRRRADPLRAPINWLIKRVAAQLRVHRAEELIGRHNAIVSTYTGRPISVFEASNARRSLAPLGEEVAKLRRHCPPGSPEALALADLAKAIASMQRQLQHYV